MAHDNPEPSFDEDKDLNEIWPQVVLEYEQVTKRRLESGTTFEAFQVQIDRDVQVSATKSHQHARKVLNNIGSCLEQFGGILAQGASMLFGPAAQCWNAIIFVIQAARKFGDVVDGFVTLMERSSAFIRRLNLFLRQECNQVKSNLPKHLRKPAYAIISEFLGVLRTSYELATSKRERLKTMMGIVLFNSDAGLAESLARLESQIQEFTNAQVDLILVDVRGLARYLRESDEVMRRHQSEIQEYVEAIHQVSEQVLSITQQMKATMDGRATKDQHNEDMIKIWQTMASKKPGEQGAWERRHAGIAELCVKGTGTWLTSDNPDFTQWADVAPQGRSVFVLKGESGFGKTHVFNRVVSHLEARFRYESGPNQANVAYYYYGDDKGETLEKCLASIIYQFAAADIGYAKAAANICGRPANVAKADDRWKNLVLGLRSHMRGTYFICIDGFNGHDSADGTLAAMARYTLSQIVPGKVSIRLLLSGTEEALSKIPQDMRSTLEIILGPRQRYLEANDEPKSPQRALNESDIEAVTRARVQNICEAKPDLKHIMNDSNIKLLIQGIRGDYNHLEAKITEIQACDTEGKVQAVINNTNDNVRTILKNNIKTLDAALSSTQIRKLNKLLLWISGMIGSPTIKFLYSALYFTSGEKFLLESEIASTFSALLKINEQGRVSFRSDDLKDILSTGSAQDSVSTSVDPPIEDISQAEIDLCRRFIKNACDPVDYARFRFDEFFEGMTHRAHIRLEDENTVNFKILKSCVYVLYHRKQDDNIRELRDYAIKWFYDHLKALVESLDVFAPDRQCMVDIGTKLADLFYQPQLIDEWFLETNITWLKYDWLYRDDYVDPVLDLWKIPYVTKSFTKDTEKGDWVRNVIANSVNRYMVLEQVAICLARRWFDCTTETSVDFLWTSYGIMAKAAGKAFDEDSALSLSEVDDYITWAKEHVKFGIADHIWATRLGATNDAFKRHEEAISAYKEAEKYPQNHANWSLALGLSRAHEKLKDFRTSLKYISKFRSLSSSYFKKDKSYSLAYWQVILTEGNCYTGLQDHRSAVECFRRVLDGDDRSELHAQALSKLFTTWTRMKDYRSILDLIRRWRNFNAEHRGPAHWLGKTIYVDNIHGCIILAAKHLEAVEEICALYQEAIDYMTSVLSTIEERTSEFYFEQRTQLQYYQAAAWLHGSRLPHNHQQGIQSWDEIIRKCDESSSSWWTAYSASRRMAPSLLDKAVSENLAASVISSKSYTSRLEAFVKMDHWVIRDYLQGQTDPRLCLVRLYHLQGRLERAFTEAQIRFCSVFDTWPENANDESLRLRFQNLAQTLNVLDKDIDAIAAWQATIPHQPEGFMPANEQSGSINTVNQANGIQPKSNSATAKPKAYISGFSCGGDCGVEWSDILADCWVCKNCLCVQLCPDCYRKLQADELQSLICNKEHKLLYLPPFDQTLWQGTSQDEMLVDKQSVPRQEWLDKIRDEYKVHQDQISSLKIQKARELKVYEHFAKLRVSRLLVERHRQRPAVRPARRAKTMVDIVS